MGMKWSRASDNAKKLVGTNPARPNQLVELIDYDDDVWHVHLNGDCRGNVSGLARAKAKATRWLLGCLKD